MQDAKKSISVLWKNSIDAVMKHRALTFFTILVFGFIEILGQGQQDFEKRTYIEINERVDFYEVDRRYNIISDTIFYSSSGFLVDAEFDVFQKDKIEYVVVTYPEFRGGKQSAKPSDSIYNVSSPLSISQVKENGVRFPIKNINGKILIIEKDKFDKLDRITLYDTRWTQGRIAICDKCENLCSVLSYVGYVIPKGKNYRLTTGLLTIPFKLRPVQDSLNFKMTTDVTIGPYLGVTKRLSKRQNYYVTLPATLGLSFVNIGDNSTSNDRISDIDVIPGFTWSSGLIFSFDKFSIGYVFGQDFASGIGNDWVYQGKLWHSFAIGYSFLNQDN